MVELSPIDKLIKARVDLSKEKPFFGFLVMHLNFIEKKDIGLIGVDIHGNCYYNPDYVKDRSKRECQGLICHEVMHLALEHFKRHRGKQGELWNVSGDAVINGIIHKDGIELPKDGIIPDGYGKIKLFGVTVTDVDNKCAEEVYHQLYTALKTRDLKDLESYIKSHQDSKSGFDVHIYPNGEKDGKDNKEGDKGLGLKSKVEGKDWGKILVDAVTYARNQGKLPAGMERIIGDILKTEHDWRTLLYKYITNQLPVDYSWARPSKKSYSTGIYLPSVVKESLDLIIAIDTSGSIRNEELKDFMGEILGILGSFSNVNLTIIDCDCEINSVQKLQHATMDDITKLRMKGGGGTSHIPVFKWVEENIPSARLLICFTDGYTTFPKSSNVQTLWVVAGYNREDVDKFPFGDVIELKSEER